ncbi:MAG: hypothetical protein JRF54_14120 [Deltaproteobacteria bacterium]|nr:hypothetical protein [Deltaproteobacteria bacterium]
MAAEEDRSALQLRLAQLYEHSFRDQVSAIGMLRQVLNADPDNEVASAELDRLFEATGAWDDLVVLLLSKVGHASDEEQRSLLGRIAEVHDAKRGEADAAIQIYERINSDLGADESSLRALAGLYERRESWTKVADTLERLSGRLDGPAAIDLSHRVADLWEQRVGDTEQAGRAIRGAYERFPQDAATRDRLKKYYQAEGDYRALAEVMDAELQGATSDDDCLTLLRTISDVYRDQLDDPGLAASYLECRPSTGCGPDLATHHRELRPPAQQGACRALPSARPGSWSHRRRGRCARRLRRSFQDRPHQRGHPT